jgi:hypothetical protein
MLLTVVVTNEINNVPAMLYYLQETEDLREAEQIWNRTRARKFEWKLHPRLEKK